MVFDEPRLPGVQAPRVNIAALHSGEEGLPMRVIWG
jgi:hypothetical protein